MLARAIATYLGANVAGLTWAGCATGGNVFVATMPDSPDVAVMVMPTGGREQLTRLPYDLPSLQVMTRGEPYDAVGPFETAAAIYSALTCLDGVTLDPGGDDEVLVVGCTAAQSAPVSIGRDANDRHEFTTNWRLHVHNPTTHRPAITA